MKLRDLIIREKLLELKKKRLAYEKKGDEIMANLMGREAALLKAELKAKNVRDQKRSKL
jgi:hypothetical protein